MNDLPEWQRKVEEKLAAVEERQRTLRDRVGRWLAEAERRWQTFGVLADRLVQTIIRPRLERLAGYFENAHLLAPDEAPRYRCVCHFRHTDRFPATTTLSLAVSSSTEVEDLTASYELQILPLFFRFEGRSEVAFPLDAVEEAQLTGWVEERMVAFVDTYLRLEGLEPYHRENLVTDPVSGLRFSKGLAAAQMQHQNQTYYFFLKACQEKFAADPQRYLEGRAVLGGCTG